MEVFNSFPQPQNMEPLFDTSNTTLGERYTLFPIKDSEQDLYKLYKKAVGTFWAVEEIDFSRDREDWDKLSSNEQHFIKNILAFFAGSDGIVQENLASRFQVEVQSPIARLFYGFQNAMEGVHSETYSLLIDQYVKDSDEKSHLFRAIDTVPTIRSKAMWALEWMDSSKNSYATRLIAFACVEGIFFSGSFCAIYWIKKRGLLPGLTFSNELISRDEGLHTEFAVAMYHKMINKLSSDVIREIVQSAVTIETEFICDALPCSLIGMNARDMTQYIQFVADRLLLQLGQPKLYNSTNPFDFMELISLEGKTNFFEKKVSEYSKPGVGLSTAEMTIKFDEEF
jgi:ribonucleotide reductase beta subunit family protein with ferritin-like domain